MKTSDLWIASGLSWFVFAMCYGTYVGINGLLNLVSSHAHAGLLGGVWSILFSWIISRRGDPLCSRLRVIQWALYNVGVASLVTGFAFFGFGEAETGESFAMPGIFAVIGSVIWIAISARRGAAAQTP